MQLYIDLVNKILTEGVKKPSGRDVPDTISYFGYHYKHDLADGFPLLTTKKVSFKAILRELIWYLSGDKKTAGYKIPFWDPWVNEYGEVPSAYGYFWRKFPYYDTDNGIWGAKTGHIDQLQMVVNALRNNPFSRRLVVSAWEPHNAWNSSLPPCHDMFIFNYDGSRLNLHLTMRSNDIPIGFPFNIAAYSLLLCIVAHETGLTPGTFSHTMVDAHIYVDQLEDIKEQIKLTPYPLPKLLIKRDVSINDVREDDFELIGYKSHEKREFKVAV